MTGPSLAEDFADNIPYALQNELLEDAVAAEPDFLFRPDWWLRPDQLDALHSASWIIAMLGGRGSGKTRTLSEWVKDKAKQPNQRIALVGRTSADVRDTMIQGESGILAVHHPDNRPEHIPSTRRLVWPNGSIAITFSAEEPSQLRGPQFHYTACDELAAWKMKPDNSGVHAWDNVKISTRLGATPQIFVATTPKRTPEIRQLVDDAKVHPNRFHLFRGATADNRSNLSDTYLETILGMYRGTSIERQELYGELLDEVEGALWTMALIEMQRRKRQALGNMLNQWRIVGVDPSVAEKPGDECGIVVIGSTGERQPFKRRATLLADYSLLASPDVWAKEAVKAAREWDAVIVAEKNQGGALVEMAIRQQDQNVPVILVTATKGKAIRAEPIVMAYEQGRVSHAGRFPELEDEMTAWVPGESGYSPNRLDALVWALTGALVDDRKLQNALTRVRASASQVARSIGPGPSWRRTAGVSQGRRGPSWRRR